MRYAWPPYFVNLFLPITRLLGIMIFFLYLALSGCISWKGKDGTTHHVIIGLGIVSCKQPTNEQILATDSKAIGISISDRPGLSLGLGYASSTVISVSANAPDVLIEVSKRPGGPIIVDTQRGRLNFERREYP